MSEATVQAEASDLAVSARLVKEVAPDRSFFIGALLLYLPVLAAQIAQPLVIGRAVDEGYRALSLPAVTLWAAVYMGTVVVQASAEMFQLYVMQVMGQRAVRRLRDRLFAKIQRLPVAYFDHMPLGKIMTRVTNDVESLSELFSSGAVRIVGDFLFLIGTLIMLFTVDTKLTLATLAVMPVLAVGVQLFRKRARLAFQRVRRILSELNGYLQEHLSGMHIVQMFGQADRAISRFEHENKAYMLANREAIALDAGVYAFVDAMSTVTVAIVLLYGASLHVDEGLTLGILVAFVEALGRFFMPIRELSNKYTVIQSALTSAERIYDLEDEEETLAEKPSAPAARFNDALRFEDVRFAYGDGPEVVRGVSFAVKKGERIALVGQTGSGKSTLVKLASRAYDVTAGRITLDGADIRDLKLKSVRDLFTSVPQDVFLFSGTIEQNICFGRDDVRREVLEQAIRDCQAGMVIDRHGGLGGEVKERGQNFSMGERQLLALVRALVTDPPILVLDEATASVDRETERRLQAATERLMEGRTALIIAHRLSTIESCDRILVLHHGEILEEGSHAELMALGGRYAKLVELQRQEGG